MFTKADSLLGGSLLHFARAVDKARRRRPRRGSQRRPARRGRDPARGERAGASAGDGSARGERPRVGSRPCWPPLPSATLHGLDGRVIRVEVDVAPGSAGVHDRRAGRRRPPGGARTGPRRDPQRRLQSIRRGGSRSTSRRPTCARPARRSTSRSRSGSCSARSRSAPGRAGWRSSASCRSAARCGRCRASCRWSPPWRGAGCGASWSRGRRGRGGAAGRGHRGRRRRDAARRGRGRPGPRGRRARRGRRRRGRARRGDRAGADGAAPARPARRGRSAQVPDLAEVRGQAEARRGLEIALAGGHGLLLIGPPGLGQDAARADDPGPPATARRRGGAGRDRRRVGAGEGPIAGFAAGRRSGPRTTRCRTRRWSAAARTCRPAR